MRRQRCSHLATSGLVKAATQGSSQALLFFDRGAAVSVVIMMLPYGCAGAIRGTA
jgi:hypothetical protein